MSAKVLPFVSSGSIFADCAGELWLVVGVFQYIDKSKTIIKVKKESSGCVFEYSISDFFKTFRRILKRRHTM